MRLKTVTMESLKPIIKELSFLLRPVAKEAFIFGSASKGFAVKYESDVDLLVVAKNQISIATIYRMLDSEIEKLLSLGLVLHIIIYDPKRHSKEFFDKAIKGIRIV